MGSKIRNTIVIVAVCLVVWSKPVYAAPTIYWGAWISNNANTAPYDYTSESNLGILGTFENRVQKKVSIIHFGQAWKDGSGAYNSFYVDKNRTGNNPVSVLMDRTRAHGAIPMLDWGSWQLGAGSAQSAYKLSNITRGDFDTYLHQWARDAASYGHPFFLRFDWEMNGNWFPWGTKDGYNGNTPADYIAAWRHVHDIFVQENATNVTWVWCINTIYTGSVPIDQLYPGSSYVDWTAIDGYNWSIDKNSSWASFTSVFNQTYTSLSALSPDKPIMIAETGSSKDRPSSDTDSTHTKANWISSALTSELLTTFPKVKAIVWFNWDANELTSDWPIEGNSFDIAAGTPIDQSSINAFSSGIGNGAYSANTFGSLATSPIQPLVSQSPTPTPSTSSTAITGFGILGDSGSDEYRADDNRGGSYGATTFNWDELLAKFRSIPFGSWAVRSEPRRTGYAYNWARSGARIGDIITQGQLSGLTAQVSSGLVNYVVIKAGANDFSRFNGTYDEIYNGSLTGSALQTKINTIISNLTTMVTTLKGAGSVKIVVANIPDRGMSPVFQAQYPDATKRQRVTNTILAVNDGISQMSISQGIALFDYYGMGGRLLAQVDQNGYYHLGNELVDIINSADEPHHALLGDAEHAGTVFEGILANEIVGILNQKYGSSIVSFSTSELLSNAGIAVPSQSPSPSLAPSPSPKPGDADGNGKVDGVDYVTWFNHYNQVIPGGNTVGDFDTSGKVDGVDYTIWFNNYGK